MDAKKREENTGTNCSNLIKTGHVSYSLDSCKPMLQHSKVIGSRDDWRRKSVQRAEELRESKKTQKRYREKIEELKAQVRALQQTEEAKKK